VTMLEHNYEQKWNSKYMEAQFVISNCLKILMTS